MRLLFCYQIVSQIQFKSCMDGQGSDHFLPGTRG